MYPYSHHGLPSTGEEENWGTFINHSLSGMYGQAAPPPQYPAGEALPANWCQAYQPGQASVVTAAPEQVYLLQAQPLVEWQQPTAPQSFQQCTAPSVAQPPAGYPSELAAAPSAHGWTWLAQGGAAVPGTASACQPAATPSHLSAASQLSAASSSSFVSVPSGELMHLQTLLGKISCVMLALQGISPRELRQ